MYQESKEDYIDNFNFSFAKDDNKLIVIKNEKYNINSNIDLLINMSLNNEIKIKFSFRGKKYEYIYSINLEHAYIDDLLHKILYYKYVNDNIYNENIIHGILNKYQLISNLSRRLTIYKRPFYTRRKK